MSKNSGLQSSGSQQLPTSQHCRNEGSRHLIRPASLTFLPIESVSCLRVGKLCTGHCFDESLTPKKFCLCYQCARKGKCNWRYQHSGPITSTWHALVIFAPVLPRCHFSPIRSLRDLRFVSTAQSPQHCRKPRSFYQQMFHGFSAHKQELVLALS